MRTVRDLSLAMDVLAPPHLAEPWDNVGLLIGDESASMERVLLCIDMTAAVVDEAVRRGCQGVVAYHPPIFKDVRRLQAGEPVFEAVRAGLSVYSPHTAYDVATGGTNDVLADALYLSHRRPLRPMPAQGDFKLITFVPPEHAEALLEALWDAGAGRIGDYERCSFSHPGTGTFRGGEATRPAVGERGVLERVEESRLEVVVEPDRLEAVLGALRTRHPYEKPAYDLFPRRQPSSDTGMGRIGEFEDAVSREVLFGRIRRELEVSHVLVAGPTHGQATRVAVCAGSCGDLLEDALAQGAELYLTGEMKHHEALRAASRGLTVVCVLHSNSERIALRRLQARLADLLPETDVELSETDRDPFVIL